MKSANFSFFHLLILLAISPALSAQSEADYIRSLATHLSAQTEVSVHGGRVDLITETHAIEVERAHKWKNSIGQALWYSLQTGKQPGIILIMEDREQYRYTVQLRSALSHAGLSSQIPVWVYPTDFPGLVIDNTPNFISAQAHGQEQTDFWLSSNSNKRHKRRCRWYEESRGRYCTATEGEPAGCCH
ncbi:MAG: hypothetical protein AAGF87_01805 [Bacteroidota bacterium]